MDYFLRELNEELLKAQFDFENALDTPFPLSESDWTQLHAKIILNRHQQRIVPLLSMLSCMDEQMKEWKSAGGTYEDEVRSYMEWASHLKLEVIRQQDALIFAVVPTGRVHPTFPRHGRGLARIHH
jgi:hypothetical protein